MYTHIRVIFSYLQNGQSNHGYQSSQTYFGPAFHCETKNSSCVWNKITVTISTKDVWNLLSIYWKRSQPLEPHLVFNFSWLVSFAENLISRSNKHQCLWVIQKKSQGKHFFPDLSWRKKIQIHFLWTFRLITLSTTKKLQTLQSWTSNKEQFLYCVLLRSI